MILMHPTTHEKIVIRARNRVVHELLKEGYKDITPPASPKQKANQQLFIELGTAARAKACLRLVLEQSRQDMSLIDAKNLVIGMSVLTDLEYKITQRLKPKENKESEGG